MTTLGENVEIVSTFGDLWTRLPKDKVLPELDDVGKTFSCAFAAGQFRVILRVSVGPRKGLTEKITIVRPDQRVKADQLVAQGTFTRQDLSRGLIELDAMKSECNEGKPIAAVCAEYILAAVQRTKTQPSTLIRIAHEIEQNGGKVGLIPSTDGRRLTDPLHELVRLRRDDPPLLRQLVQKLQSLIDGCEISRTQAVSAVEQYRRASSAERRALDAKIRKMRAGSTAVVRDLESINPERYVGSGGIPGLPKR